MGSAVKILFFPPHGAVLCNTVLQTCRSLETLLCCLRFPVALQIFIICFLFLYPLPSLFLSLSDTYRRHSSQDSQLTLTSQEPDTPDSRERESFQVRDHSRMPGGRGGPKGCWCWSWVVLVLGLLWEILRSDAEKAPPSLRALKLGHGGQ